MIYTMEDVEAVFASLDQLHIKQAFRVPVSLLYILSGRNPKFEKEQLRILQKDGALVSDITRVQSAFDDEENQILTETKTEYATQKFASSYTGKKLSKGKIRLLLTYLATSMSNEGFTPYMYLPTIAAFTGMSLSHVKECNKELEESGLLSLSHHDKRNPFISCYIPTYAKMNELQASGKKKDREAKYIWMSKEVLVNIINLPSVSAVRLALNTLLSASVESYDTENLLKLPGFTKKDIPQITSSYVKTVKQMKELQRALDSTFDTYLVKRPNTSILFLKLKEELDGVNVRKWAIQEIEEELTRYVPYWSKVMGEHLFKDPFTTTDLATIEFNYGRQIFAAAINAAKQYSKHSVIDDLVAFIQAIVNRLTTVASVSIQGMAA